MMEDIENVEVIEAYSITEEQFNDLYNMQEIQTISICMLVGLVIVLIFTRKF